MNHGPISYEFSKVVELTGVCATNVRKAVREGRLRARYLGRKPLFLREDVEEWQRSLPEVAPHRRKEAAQ